jgi:hypothetical protein
MKRVSAGTRVDGSQRYTKIAPPDTKSGGAFAAHGAGRDYMLVPVEPAVAPPAAIAGMVPQTTGAPGLSPDEAW